MEVPRDKRKLARRNYEWRL